MTYPKINQDENLFEKGWVVCPAMYATCAYNVETETLTELPAKSVDFNAESIEPVHRNRMP